MLTEKRPLFTLSFGVKDIYFALRSATQINSQCLVVLTGHGTPIFCRFHSLYCAFRKISCHVTDPNLDQLNGTSRRTHCWKTSLHVKLTLLCVIMCPLETGRSRTQGWRQSWVILSPSKNHGMRKGPGPVRHTQKASCKKNKTHTHAHTPFSLLWRESPCLPFIEWTIGCTALVFLNLFPEIYSCIRCGASFLRNKFEEPRGLNLTEKNPKSMYSDSRVRDLAQGPACHIVRQDTLYSLKADTPESHEESGLHLKSSTTHTHTHR